MALLGSLMTTGHMLQMGLNPGPGQVQCRTLLRMPPLPVTGLGPERALGPWNGMQTGGYGAQALVFRRFRL